MDKNQSLHSFIKEALLDRIKSNQYKKGEQIPPELELCKDFNVSRTTVRTALNQLATEGYLVRKQGSGTYVADRKVEQELSSTVHKYSDQIADQGKSGETALLSISVIPANEALKQALEVNLNDPIQRIERIRKANGEPTQYEISFIPWNVAPGMTKEHAETSLYDALKKDYGVRIAKTVESIEITLADENISKYLECQNNLPCFFIETVASNKMGEKVEYSKSYFRGDKTNFTIERNYPLD